MTENIWIWGHNFVTESCGDFWTNFTPVRQFLHMRISAGLWMRVFNSGTFGSFVFKLGFYCFLKGNFTAHTLLFFIAALFSMPFFSLPIFMSEPYQRHHATDCQPMPMPMPVPSHPIPYLYIYTYTYVYLFNRDSSNSAIVDGFCLANTICICSAIFLGNSFGVCADGR